MLLGCWNILYQICHIPNHLAKAAAKRMRAEFDPLDQGFFHRYDEPKPDDDDSQDPKDDGKDGDDQGSGGAVVNPDPTAPPPPVEDVKPFPTRSQSEPPSAPTSRYFSFNSSRPEASLYLTPFRLLGQAREEQQALVPVPENTSGPENTEATTSSV